MFNVALTGNIAAGKSSVVDLLRRWGATVIDADELARQAQAPGGEVLAAIVRRFGADVLAPDGALDRAALRAKVMGDQAALDALNQIVHPAVRQRRDELLSEARERGDALVVNDIPLLFEVLDPAQFDIVVLVDAATTVRRTRLRAMRGLSNDEADRMLAVQMPAERKRGRTRSRARQERHDARRDRRHGRDGAGGRTSVGAGRPAGRARLSLRRPRSRRCAARPPALGLRAAPVGRARRRGTEAAARPISRRQPVALTEVSRSGNLRPDLRHPRERATPAWRTSRPICATRKSTST